MLALSKAQFARRHQRIGRAQLLDVVRQIQRNAPVTIAQRLDAEPPHFAGAQQRIQHLRRVAAHARREHLAIEQRCHQRDALQLLDHIQQAVEAGSRRRQSVPAHQEPAERRRVHRLHFLPQLGERALPHTAPYLDLAPLASASTGPELAVDHPAALAQAQERGLDHGGAESEACRGLVAGERAMRPRVAPHEVADRVSDAFEQRRGQAVGKGDANGVAIARGVLDRDQSRLAADHHLDGAPRLDEFGDRWRRGACHAAGGDLATREVAQAQQ